MSATSAAIKKADRKVKYKELIEKGTHVGENLENQNVLDSFKLIMGIIDHCEDISTEYVREAKIENTGDYLLDAQIIKMSHDLMGTMTEKMSNCDFREDEYGMCLIEMMNKGPNEILDTTIGCFQNANFHLPMLGTFDFDAEINRDVTRKPRQQRTRKTLEPKSAPEKIEKIVKVDKGAEKINITQSELQRVFKQRGTEIPFYELITNPQSFMKTVDAAFQLAFLVRDGIIGLKKIDKEPYVFLIDAPARSQSSGESGQVMMALDPAKWTKNIEKFKLKKPLLNLEVDEMEVEND